MELLRVICSAERRLVCGGPPCSEKQAGIGPISQKPELVTMGLNYDDALDRTRGGEQSIISLVASTLPVEDQR
jgi:hypothetical protein